MAEAVASLIDSVFNRLDSHASDLSRRKNFIQMRVKLAETRALLDDANSDPEHPNSSLKLWFSVIRDLAYDVDGLIDNWEESENKRATCSLSSLVNSSKIEQEFKSIHVRLVSLLNLFYNFPPDDYFESNTISDVGFVRSDEYVVFGRDFEVSTIVNRMVFDIEGKKLEIFPIVGMGGIGKTVLAQRIYNDENVKTYFQIRVWVSVGEKSLDVETISQAIEVGCSKIRGKGNVMEARYVLEGKRFLIVLDDVWDEDGENLEKVKSWLSVGDLGSCVLVTTRSSRVACMMGSVLTQHLTCFSNEDSWVLFRHFAFGSVEEGSSELEEIGRNIVVKCKGLPIAIKTIGCLLFSKDKEVWSSIVDCDLWTLLEFKSHVLPVLKRSYDNLPWYLKQCFAYCSIFPKDYWINKEKLVHMWLAEGFIRLDSGSEDLKETADDYFVELLQHSFFDNIVSDDFGVVLCRMHDFMHVLAQLAAGGEYSIVSTGDSQNIHVDVRHCSLIGDLSSSIIPTAQKLRTLLLLSFKLENLSLRCQEFQCLRVLDLSQSGLIKLPISIGTLKHLRYLDLSHTHIRRIPESISKLKHLQTLDLSNCYNLEELSKSICQLENLRTLDIRSCYSLTHMPSGIGKLRLIRKLPAFVLGKKRRCAGLGELKSLDLQGRLEIKNLENVKKVIDAEEAKLHDKLFMHSLGLSWSRNSQTRYEVSEAVVIESLRPPQDLKVLDLKGYRGSISPSWLNSGLPNLVKVSLVDCCYQELPPLGQLPNLTDLYVKGMPAVQVIGYSFYGNGAIRGFPSLQQLQLYDMPNLKEWKGLKTEGTDEPFPCLEKLVVEGCSMLTAFPFIPNLKNLALCNSNEKLLCSLSHFPSLSSLVVDNFPELNSLSDKNRSFNSIVKLTVHNCDNLETLFAVVQSFSSLKHLSILHCYNLGSLPMSLKQFSVLQKLDIVECPRLFHIPEIMGQLSLLQELTIEGCPLLNLSPKSIDFISHLQRLVIEKCPELERQLRQLQTSALEKSSLPFDTIEYEGGYDNDFDIYPR